MAPPPAGYYSVMPQLWSILCRNLSLVPQARRYLCNMELRSFNIVAGWLLQFYILATSKVISGQVPTCDSVVLMRDQAARTRTWYPTQSHDPVTEPISYCPTLLMLAGKRQVSILKSLVWFEYGSNPWVRIWSSPNMNSQLIRPSCLV